jgi:branched-chain amino acid transport system permease protein
MAASILIWSIFAIGFDLAFGAAGLLSFGHAAFYGMGAYGVALLFKFGGVPPIIGLILSTLLVALAAIVIGLFALRLSGIFFGLTTMAIGQLVEVLFSVRLSKFTGGDEGITGIPRPSLLGWELRDSFSFLLFVAIIFVVVLGASSVLRSSPWGRALNAMRQNEVRAEQLGLNVRRLKLSAFAVSGAFAGLAGGLAAMLSRFVNPGLLHWTVSGDILVTILIGGLNTVLGPVAGAVLFELLQESLSRVADRWHAILGIILIGIVLFIPGGLAELARRIRGVKA